MRDRSSSLRVLTIAAGLLAALLAPTGASAQLTPAEAAGLMARGISLGNTLEPPYEGAWNNGPAREYYFDDFRDAGFTCVRVPVRWDNHTGRTAPYAVSASWMDRVEQVVDWGLERGLFVIINGHHEDWLKQGYADPNLRARYDSIWVQISERFRDKSDRLLFEIINEPFGMTRAQVDDLNSRILGIIRRTNPTRIVVYSGNEWSGSAQMMAAAVPDDDYLMAYFHSYDPWEFAGEATGTWGTNADRDELARQFQSVADWSASTGIPVMIGEFGAVHAADYNSRMAHYAAYVEESLRHGIAFQAWDDGGDFGIYGRASRTWNEVKDILMGTYPDGPTRMSVEVRGDSAVALAWTNRADSYAGIRVERMDASGRFVPIAALAGQADRYTDRDVSPGSRYTYRVVGLEDGHPERLSYPQRSPIVPERRAAFHGAPLPIPGTIEAEDFDFGGEGLAYHDTEEANIPGAYRVGAGVDVEARQDGGFHVGYVEPGEWIEYTVDVLAAGTYEIRAQVASLDGGGRFWITIGSVNTRSFIVPKTGSWETTTVVSTTANLQAGTQVMRVSIAGLPPFNLDRFELTALSPTGTEATPPEAALSLYPNPVRGDLTLVLDRPPGPGTWIEVVDVLGRVRRRTGVESVRTRIALDGLPPGVYGVRLLGPAGPVVQRTVVVF